jgi:hypothetical protein
MADQLQLRGGTTSEHATFTGALREVTVDTDKDTVVVHDNATVGGKPLMREDASNSALALGSAATPSLKWDANTGIYSPGADQVAVATNGVGRLFVNSSGQVGINGAPPAWASSSSISVNEAAFSPALSYVGGEGELTHNAYYDGAWKYSGTGYQAARIQLGVQGTIRFLNTPTIGTAGGAITWQERLRITAAGLVGIGTSSPSELLHIAGVTNPGIVLQDTTNNTDARIKTNNNGDLIFEADYNAEAADTRISFEIDGSEKARFDSSGRLGIGTTSPNGTLTVEASSGRLLTFRNPTTGTGASDGSYIGLGGSDLQISNAESASTIFYTADTERARIDSSGRLLVGTSTARAGYAGGNNFTPYFQIEGNSDGTRYYSFTNNSNAIAPSAPVLNLTRSRSSSIGGTTLVQSGDWLGALSFNGYDGTNPIEAATIKAEVDGTPGVNDMPGRLVFSTTADGASSTTERMRITSDGNVLVGKTSSSFGVGDGTVIGGAGYLAQTRTSATPFTVIRNGTDGTLVSFEAQNVEEGTISVSGTTVSYNGAHLSRWSQLPSGAERTEILRGSVLSNLDEMCEWIDPPTEAVLWEEGDELPEGVNVGDIKEPANPGGPQSNEQLNRMKVSDVEGDKNVSGVFQAWDDDDDTYTNDFYCAMTGDFIIRIAEGVIVERGDLLMSAGDGTAKPQNDDIIRSKTIAKVTSTNVSCTYEDGSYCVPCVLMAC